MMTLGLDPSSTKAGAALVEDGSDLVWAALWKRPKGLAGIDAMGGFQQWLARHISYGEFADMEDGVLTQLSRPERALVEYDMVQRGGKTIRALARYEGVCICTCQQMGIEVKDITPSSARLRGLGNGGLNKPQAAGRVHEMFPEFDWSEDKGHDVADAVVLALSAFHKWE